MKRSHILILAAGDLLALLAFVWLGQMDHQTLNTSNPLLGALPTAAPLAGAWLIAAWLMNAYPRDGALPRLPIWLGRTTMAWLVAAPIGLMLRTFWLNLVMIPAIFLLVTLAGGALFLLAWRLVFWLIMRRR
ncbi:MAG: DUF3054 domain-containing protein [Anaerolineae bacterium]